MQEDIFKRTLDVDLTDVEVRAKFQTAASCWRRMDVKELQIERLKEDHKDALKKLEGEKKGIRDEARTALTCAEQKKEPRPVDCRQELHGSTVVTIRCDTEETVDDRAATPEELKAEEEARKKVKIPASADEMRARIMADAVKLCRKAPRVEHALKKMIAKALPQATDKEIAAAILAAIQGGKLEEVDGKLCVPAESAVVPDDYQPDGATRDPIQ